jgi:hypothetical protein
MGFFRNTLGNYKTDNLATFSATPLNGFFTMNFVSTNKINRLTTSFFSTWNVVQNSTVGSIVNNHLGDYPTPKTITYF